MDNTLVTNAKSANNHSAELMLLVNAKGMLFEVPVDMLSGTKMTNWVEHKEDILELFQDLKEVLMNTQEFGNDFEGSERPMACCGCASGQSAVMNYAKHER
jgi:hypothetical protein